MELKRSIYKLFVTPLTLAILITITMSLIPSSRAIDIETPYAITFDIAGFDIAPKYVYMINSSSFILAGKVNGTDAIVIMRIIDPYKGLTERQIYPLVGEPTVAATNGFPVKRIAIGTSKGEILLFNVDGGRIVGYLYTILGADFYVDKLAIMKTATGSFVVAALVHDSQQIRFIYIFNEDGKGMIRIGSDPGDVTITYSGIDVYDMAPLKVITSSEIYYNASRLLIAYTLATKTVVLNISMHVNNTYVPAPNTLVEVVVYDKSAPREQRTVYGVNADSNGVARIPIPLLYGDRTYANITIRDILGNTLFFYTVTPTQLIMPKKNVFVYSVKLFGEPNTNNAIDIYGVPQFLKLSLELLDVSTAPYSYTSVALSPRGLDVNIRGLHFITSEGANRYILIYTCPQNGYLYIDQITVVGRELRTVVSQYDYIDRDHIGREVESVDAIVYKGNQFLHIALSDGRIRTYQLVGDRYTLIHIYNVGESVKRLSAYIEAKGYAYAAITSNGIQIVSIDPYLVPFLRNNLSIVATIDGYIDADILSDFSMGIMVSQTKAVVIVNLYALLSSKPVTLDDIMAPTLRLKIYLPGNETYDKVNVKFSYPAGYISSYRYSQGYLLLKPSKNGTIEIPNIIPGVSYSIDIWYDEPYIQPETKTLSTDRLGRDIEIPVTMRYKEYNLTLYIKDQFDGSPIAPYRAVIDGKTVVESSTAQKIVLKLIYGSHNIEIIPAPGHEAVYQGNTTKLFIDRDMELDIKLIRKTYRVAITLLDSLTNTPPIVPINISLGTNLPSIVFSNASMIVDLPYGNYSVLVAPAKGYENAYTSKEYTLSIARDTSITMLIDRKRYTLSISLTDTYTKNLVAPMDIYLNGTLVSSDVWNDTTIIVPYGVWTLRIAPVSGYENAYDVIEDTINIVGNTVKQYSPNRRIYDVIIDIRDVVGRVIAPLELSIYGVVSPSILIDPSNPRAILSLPYGNYTCVVRPAKGYEYIYTESRASLSVDRPKAIAITVDRVRYILSISLKDTIIGILRGRFEVYVNGTKIIDNIGGPTNITLPCGIYTVYVSPMPAFSKIYSVSKPITINLFNSTSIEIPVPRNMYTLKFVVLEGETPIRNAEITIISEETGNIFTKLVTDEYGTISTKIPFGSYRIEISHPNYETRYVMLDIDSDRQEIVYLRPTILTYIQRFLPIIGILIGIGVAIYIGLRIRAMITKRIAIEEEVF
ncbi:hypothetical protein Igag_1679 [Ignisphaera aggregans DSM 17230]|uniref:Carboxypeptidase regulatory-like domain-containing protein n=1 Tax=Ignisphaera aggregans (strain DSM 17230 / JCM 13409 / AQ1.S1) TaxID=583356 RepID=E0SRU5_IGNAA|nr:hypothetical protein Igag_1679 [Ignisphaera aggregans DSM 17230]